MATVFVFYSMAGIIFSCMPRILPPLQTSELPTPAPHGYVHSHKVVTTKVNMKIKFNLDCECKTIQLH